MSVTVMGKVWDSDLEPNHRLVLLAYADHANDDGTSIYPGEERMCEKTAYSGGNVRRITTQLIADGLLVRVAKGHKGQRAVYAINLEALDAKARKMRAFDGADDSKGAHPGTKGAHPGTQRRALSASKARAGATPNHHEPSENHQEPSLVGRRAPEPPLRKRDLLWEAVVEIHGDPATDSERGKLNRAVGDLRNADVTAEEYPTLVAAFATKHSRANQTPPQPTAITIATRIGELRHFVKRGPIGAPLGTLDDLARDQKRRQDVAALEAEYGTDGKQKQQRMEATQ